MRTIQDTINETFRDRGSKFIGYLFPVSSIEQFENELTKIKSDFPDASHHCYAWRIHPTKIEEFAQDDGEPGGSAGLPILNKLKSYEMVNCGCVVVRYFGGTKLGKSGLIQAYGHTAALCLDKATSFKIIATTNFRITYPYSQQTQINQLKNSFDLKELESEYLEQVTLKMACRKEQADQFSGQLEQLEHLGIEVDRMGPGFVTMQD